MSGTLAGSRKGKVTQRIAEMRAALDELERKPKSDTVQKKASDAWRNLDRALAFWNKGHG
jgi:hypothetical protein